MRSGAFSGLLLILCLPLAVALPAFGGSTPASGTTGDQLITQQAANNPTSFGDYISAVAGNGGLDAPYRYYIEVPDGQSCLVVEIFDADVGTSQTNNDAANERDRARSSFNTSAAYRLFTPGGASVTGSQLFTTGNSSGPNGADDNWLVLYAGASSATYRDPFGTAAYNNNDGTASWSGNWTEFGDNGSATTGNVWITAGALRVRAATRGVTRQANLSGACAAVLTLDVADVGNLEGSDCADVSVSANGGSTWTVLEEFCNDLTASVSYDITSFIASNTQVRLRASNSLNGSGEAFSFDNVQIETRSGAPARGHWQLEVDMTSSQTGGDDINAFGIRAHDGNSGAGGTEYNVYAESFFNVGINDNGRARDYTLYPYITSGCTGDLNNFDWDANSGGGSPPNPPPFGSWGLTSRSGAFTDDNGGSMSNDDAWLNDTFTGWTDDDTSSDYGIWRLDTSIATYTASGNYGVLYLGNDTVANPPPGAQPQAGTFRLYLPSDAGGAPVKPYLAQDLTWVSGPNPPTVGNTSRFAVSVRVANPTPHDIAFSTSTAGSNVVRTRVATGAVFVAGSLSTDQGGATESAGTVTWAPGTVAAGATAVMSYRVDVTPAGAGRIPVTGTPASNGTTATFVDGTCGGGTPACTGAQLTRATMTLGPLCELAASTLGATPVLVSSFSAYETGGDVVVEWRTASEAGTVAFDLYRREGTEKIRLNRQPLLSVLDAPQGGVYRLVDPGASPSEAHTYDLVETTADGRRQVYGPYPVTVETRRDEPSPDGYSRAARAPSDGFFERRAAPAPPGVKSPSDPPVALKVAVREGGLYRLAASEISARLGVTLGEVVSALHTHRLRLTQGGREVAWTSAGNDGLDFYGEGIDSPYTAENVYRIELGDGLDFGRVTVAGAAPAGPGSFEETVHFEEDNRPIALLGLDPDGDFWFWDFVSGGGSKTFTLELPGVAPGNTDAALAIHYQGALAGHHVLDVAVNGSPVGRLELDDLAGGTTTLTFRQSLLQGGANAVEITAAGGLVLFDGFDVTYRRLPQAAAGRLLARGEGQDVLTFSGFESPGVRVFDVSEARVPSELSGMTLDQEEDGLYRVSFVPARDGAVYLATDGPRAPAAVTADLPSSLRSTANAAEYVVVTTAELFGAAEELAAYRTARGLSATVVDLEDVYDEFNDGVADPHALRDFLAYAYANWTVPPRFVVLAGAGTYDYKDDWGLGGNLVPPLMTTDGTSLFATDARFADVVGEDGAPEMAIGRIPAVSAAELAGYVAKLVAYESDPAPEWGDRVMLLADDPDSIGDYGADSDRLAELLPPGFSPQKIYLGEQTLAAARESLFDGLADGAAVVSYVGHGGIDVLAAEGLLTGDDVAALSNGDRLPVVTALTCHVGLFAVPGFDGLGEVLTVDPDGGAAAVWAPGWLSDHVQARVLGRRLFHHLFGDGSPVLGEAARRALADGAAAGIPRSLLLTYQLLGDPALAVRLAPETPPPAPLSCGDLSLGDSDGDGSCDHRDLCPGFDDAADGDADGVPDACDLCGGDDAAGDADGDGVCGDVDLCLGNDAAGDADHDGICADLDCDDTGGDCSIFTDGFEAGGLRAWSSALP